MNKYGKTAIKAAKYVKEGYEARDAWEKASCEFFPKGSAAQTKGCPRNAFLGLYGGGGKNAKYAQTALLYLRANPKKLYRPDDLWKIIMSGTVKTHNNQMDVVLSLYNFGLI